MRPNVEIPISDVQSYPDRRNICVNKVGVKNILHPLIVQDGDYPPQRSVAQISMFVNLPASVKGTHMSRFVEILNENETVLSVESMPQLLDMVVTRLQAEQGFISVSFPFFVEKAAPVSQVKGLLNYQVTLSCSLVSGRIINELQVVVPVTSLCPCSKEIADYGAHNQRSHVTVSARINGKLSIHALISLIEKEASCELFAILKRPDEKLVTEKAYDNPKFVEDVVRDVATQLDKVPVISAYRISSENFESIHNHSAYAEIEREK